jgi:hypothetical protein
VGILDLFELFANWGPCPFFIDCNDNGAWDLLEAASESSLDCNGNVVPDECDIAGGSSFDFNGNGIPDDCEPVANDDCQGAIPITEGETFVLTVGATTGGFQMVCGGAGTTFVKDVWFLYTPPHTGMTTFSLCGDAGFDTLLAVGFAQSCPNPVVALACSDNAPGCGLTSEVRLTVVGGIPYLIRVGGTEGGGAGTLAVSRGP